MKKLLILRHAKSSWKDSDTEDHERPLNKRGKQDAPKIGGLLKDQGLLPDVIIGSTAKRIRQTIDRIITASGYHGPVYLLPELYLAEPKAYIDQLKNLGGQVNCPMIVGHNPSLEEVVGQLTGSNTAIPTGALIEIELSIDGWQELDGDEKGRVINQWQPKDLK